MLLAGVWTHTNIVYLGSLGNRLYFPFALVQSKVVKPEANSGENYLQKVLYPPRAIDHKLSFIES